MSTAVVPVNPFSKLSLLSIEENSFIPKYSQIVEIIMSDIHNGIFKAGEMIPSIHETSMEFSIAKNTVEKAYKILKRKGIVISVKGKGFFVSSSTNLFANRILVLLSAFDRDDCQIYEGLLESLPNTYEVDLYLYNGKPDMLRRYLFACQANYDQFILIPSQTFENNELQSIIESIPEAKLKKVVPTLDIHGHCESSDKRKSQSNKKVHEWICQKLMAYKHLNLVFPENPFYANFISDIRDLCLVNNVSFTWYKNHMDVSINKGEAYFVMKDEDLAEITKVCDKHRLRVGRDVGLVCFDDSTLKQILKGGISVMKPDYKSMGSSLAKCIITNNFQFIGSEVEIIERLTM